MNHLRAQWRQAVKTAMPMNPPEGIQFMLWTPEKLLEHNPGVVAILGQEAIGVFTVRLSLQPKWFPHRSDLLYVKPEYRRRGIGTLLWQQLRQSFPGIIQSQHRSEMGEAWAISSEMADDAGERQEEYPQDEAERAGAEVLALVQKDLA